MKFQVGDRVRAFGFGDRVPGEDFVMTPAIFTGTVRGRDGDTLILHPSGEAPHIRVAVHFKACRKLVKKERRRVWLHYYGQLEYPQTAHEAHGKPGQPGMPCAHCVEFVELRRKKK